MAQQGESKPKLYRLERTKNGLWELVGKYATKEEAMTGVHLGSYFRILGPGSHGPLWQSPGLEEAQRIGNERHAEIQAARAAARRAARMKRR